MNVLGRPANDHLYLRGNPTGGGRGVTTAPNSGPREITHVVPEYTIFAEDFRIPETEIPKVQWGGSRASILAGLKSGYCLARHSAPSLLRMLDGVPRRISLGFAHSAAAAGNWRREVVRSMHLLGTSFEFPTIIPEARGTVWLADRLAGGLAGLAGWRADGREGCKMHIFTTKSGH